MVERVNTIELLVKFISVFITMWMHRFNLRTIRIIH